MIAWRTHVIVLSVGALLSLTMYGAGAFDGELQKPTPKPPGKPLKQTVFTWRAGKGGSPVNNYVIACQDADSNVIYTQRVAAHGAAGRINGAALLPPQAGVYTCWVVAMNKVGPSPPSNSIKVSCTEMISPKGKPDLFCHEVVLALMVN